MLVWIKKVAGSLRNLSSHQFAGFTGYDFSVGWGQKMRRVSAFYSDFTEPPKQSDFEHLQAVLIDG